MRTTPTSNPKILSEFTLLPANRDRLAAFFREDPSRVRNSQQNGELIQLLHDTLPIQALEEAERIFDQRSEYALRIRGLPESQTVPYYCDAIARALYNMNGARFHYDRTLARGTHNASSIVGGVVHRDYPQGHVAGMAAPLNAEHALTEVIDMEGALKVMPPELLLHIETLVTTDGMRVTNPENLTAAALRPRVVNKADCARRFVNEVTSADRAAFEGAIAQFNVQLDMQPGDLLLFDEHRYFHRAHFGDKGLAPPGTDITRIFNRYAGSVAGR